MHTINYKSKERDVRLAEKANAIKFQRKLKAMLLTNKATQRIRFELEERNMALGIL